MGRPRRGDPSGQLLVLLRRDGPWCAWCGREINTDLVAGTVDHLVPRVKGGPSWPENEVAACSRCNSQRGHLTPAEWLEECERRGWRPRHDVVVGTLKALQRAIEERGGQRRARPYLDSQLRRIT